MAIIIKDLGTIDIGTGGTTASQEIEIQHGWSLAPVVTGTPGLAKYTVQVSQDDVDYFDYKSLAIDVPIETALQDIDFNWRFMQIVVVPGGPSSGTVQLGLLLKR